MRVYMYAGGGSSVRTSAVAPRRLVSGAEEGLVLVAMAVEEVKRMLEASQKRRHGLTVLRGLGTPGCIQFLLGR